MTNMNKDYTEDLILRFKEDYNLIDSDFWKHKQSGAWIIKHNALEKIAAQDKITWKLEVLNFSPDVVIKCIATNNERVIESIGEASPKNCIIGFPYAMAEKRGVDRCILKLLNAHAYIYSDAEADEFKQPRPAVDAMATLNTIKGDIK